jgi:hypothetical protein
MIGDKIKGRRRLGSEAMEGALKLARQVSDNFGASADFWRLNFLFSTGMNKSSPNARISSLDIFPITVTRLLRCLCRDTLHAAHNMMKFSNMKTFTRCRQRTQGASNTRKRPWSSTWKGSARNSRTSSSSLDQIQLLDVGSLTLDGLIAERRCSYKVVAETVVGATTGALAAPKGYFKAMKSVCRKYGALFILDEVMSGMGRESPGPP